MTVLRLEEISKHFGAIHALNNFSMAIEKGEVVGLMGDNGAGKSTLVKIIAGNFRPSHGRIFIKDREVQFHRPVEARENGIEIVYQDLALCDNLSAAVNVFLGREMTRRLGPFRIMDYRGMNAVPACSRNSNRRRVRRIWSRTCQAASGRRLPSPGPGCHRQISC